MVIHQVKLASTLPDEEVRAVMGNRTARLRETPGLLQTYCTRLRASSELCGIYVFESDEALQAFKESDLGRSLAPAYSGDSLSSETYEVIQPLHAERGQPTRLAI